MAVDDPATGGLARPICPVCRRDEPTMKVSAIYRQQRGYGSSTELAELLEPPVEPRLPSQENRSDEGMAALVMLAIAGGSAFLFLAQVYSLIFDRNSFNGWLLLAFAIVLPISLWLLRVLFDDDHYKRLDDKYRKGTQGRQAFQQYERATAKWDRGYYCQKDDACFVPGEPGFCASPDFQRWLTE